MIFPNSGLYAITQTTGKSNESVIQNVRSALEGGACVIQYRDKNTTGNIYLAKELLNLCKHYQVPLIINDNVELAYQVGADGVHIGQNDGSISTARKILGKKAIIGISCYDNIDVALKAENDGVNYVAFGRFFPSNSKPMALLSHTETLRQAKIKINLPIVAIGGILPENGAYLLAAGANLLAVIGGIFDHNPEQSARAYTHLFK